MPSSIIVVFHPKVVATFNQDDYNYVHSQFQANGGISFGPFGFGASYGRSNSTSNFDDQHLTVTMEDVSDSPQVIGVISSVLPQFK